MTARYPEDLTPKIKYLEGASAALASPEPPLDEHYDGCPRCEHCACAGVTRLAPGDEPQGDAG